MSRLARIGLVLLGPALAAPPHLWAAPPDSTPPQANAKKSSVHSHRAGWFRKRHLCPDCQRAELLAQGIQVPPPPATPRGVVMRSEPCPRCEEAAMAAASAPGAAAAMPPIPARSSGPAMAATAGNPPGYAVVGAASAPGYAVTVPMAPTAQPTPIGVVQANYSRMAPPTAAHPAAPGGPAGEMTHDAMRNGPMTPQVPPPVTAVTGPPSRSPNILGHMLGLTALGRRQREAWERRRRESHASLSYDPPNQQVTDLPASMVFGR
jgi:hypothetical protein